MPAISATPSTIAIPVSSARTLRSAKPRSTSLFISRSPSSGRAPARRSPPRRRGRSCRRPARSSLSANDAACASWVTITTVWPKSSTAWRSSERTSPEAVESRLPDGSSANTTAGREIRARATATRCCCPPDSSAGRWLSLSRMPTVSISRSNHSRSGFRPAIDSGSRMFSSAFSTGSRLNVWKTKPIFSRRSSVSSSSLSSVRSTPAMRTVPEVGRSRPARMCSSVDLPDPEGPMIAAKRPAGKSRSRPRARRRRLRPRRSGGGARSASTMFSSRCSCSAVRCRCSWRRPCPRWLPSLRGAKRRPPRYVASSARCTRPSPQSSSSPARRSTSRACAAICRMSAVSPGSSGGWARPTAS